MKKVGKILLWVFFFPIMLTIMIVKSKKLTTIKKLIVLLLFWGIMLFGALLSGDSEAGTTADIPTEDSVETSLDHAQTMGSSESVESQSQSLSAVKGESADYPFVISAEELVAEINNDIASAKNKYNGKWIKITGKVTYISDGGSMFGYYLYGKRGDEGLKITCWINENKKLTTVGQTVTFLGIVREITTVNNTEIAECKIVE